jgi:hypothetical protein
MADRSDEPPFPHLAAFNASVQLQLSDVTDRILLPVKRLRWM